MELLQNFSSIPFFIFATSSVLFALGMIFNPNLIRAGFLLIGSFVSIAGLYFLLAANFVAVSQILIYAVGIVLVIIFAVMLCSLKETASDAVDEEKSELLDINKRKFMALLVSSSLFYVLYTVINSQDWLAVAHINGATNHLRFIDEISSQYTIQIGNLMLSRYILPFELVSILLLIVLVGVIILSKKNIDGTTLCEEKK